MSECEFENYLALLGGLLRLGPKQRSEIAGELRDHLEERLAELTSNGVPRDEAIGQALAEFGDAAGMAAAFLDISRNRRKRWIMKWTAYSIGGLAASVLLAVALWPEGANVKLTPKAAAQVAKAADPEAAAADPGTPAATAVARPLDDGKTREDNNAAAEAVLSKQIASEFVETPLGDVIDFLQDLTGLEFYVNWKKLDEEGVSKDAPVTIRLKKVRVDMVLDLVLAQVGDNVAYILRDGIVILSTSDDLEHATEVRVYNCRDLLKLSPPMELGMASGMSMGGMPGRPPTPGGFGGGLGGAASSPPGGGPTPSDVPGGRLARPGGPSVPGLGGGPTPPQGPGPPGGGMMSSMSGMMGGGPGLGGMAFVGDAAAGRAEQLINILTTSVAPDTWQESGGFGTVAEYSGLLVVNHNARTHRQIEKVLSMLRESIAKDAAAGSKVPANLRTKQH